MISPTPSYRAALAFSALLAAAGCAHPSQPQMTAESHLAESARHREAAAQEEKRYDPAAMPVSEIRGPFAETPAGSGSVLVENPTVHHLRAADGHLRAAAQHDAEAKKLTSEEASACQGLREGERQACPLWPAVVSAAQETPRGVRLSLKSGVDGVALAARMTCHLAHGRAHGWDGGCPLVVPGASVTMTGAGTMEIRGDSAQSIAAIQAEARKLFSPKPPPAPAPVSRR
ncbi:MAG TPA: hypothetical protein VFA20_32080 [Myxococcaceae bacterium]|nr:hypothetical protein [Myxococcaceae bacterium]